MTSADVRVPAFIFAYVSTIQSVCSNSSPSFASVTSCEKSMIRKSIHVLEFLNMWTAQISSFTEPSDTKQFNRYMSNSTIELLHVIANLMMRTCILVDCVQIQNILQLQHLKRERVGAFNLFYAWFSSNKGRFDHIMKGIAFCHYHGFLLKLASYYFDFKIKTSSALFCF